MTTDDRPRTIRDGLVPLGPEDTYNGVKVSSFCMECRDGIARYEHGMQASVTLCGLDLRKVAAAQPYDPATMGHRQEWTGPTTDDKPAPANLLGSKWVHRQHPLFAAHVVSVSPRIELRGYLPKWQATIDDGPGGVEGGGHRMVFHFETVAAMEADWVRVPSDEEIDAASSVHVVGDKPAEFFEAAQMAVASDKPAPHPAPEGGVILGDPIITKSKCPACGAQLFHASWQRGTTKMLASCRTECCSWNEATPRPQHPGPWRWKADTFGGEFLSDADGRWIIGDDTGSDAGLAKALIAAAPEMAAMLRELEHVGCEGDEGYIGPQCPDCESYPDKPHAPDCRLHALLARIDAAADAGKAKGG